jgi:hypothetical protein
VSFEKSNTGAIEVAPILTVMKITIAELKKIINESLNELGGPTGSLRKVAPGGRQQYKIGKIEDENRELSFSEAEHLFPGSTVAWAEIVPELYPEFPFHDPLVIKRRSLFFKIGPKLTVAFADVPQIELATWDQEKQDWIEN